MNARMGIALLVIASCTASGSRSTGAAAGAGGAGIGGAGGFGNYGGAVGSAAAGSDLGRGGAAGVASAAGAFGDPVARDAQANDGGQRDAPSADAQAGQPDAGPRTDGGAQEAGVEADPCGSDAVSTGATAANTRQGSPGSVAFVVSASNEVVSLTTTLTVPAEPPPSGTLFLWPGLQPVQGARNYDPIDNGVLQPVLTWGPSCAPHSLPDHASWWISSQYVNTFGSYPGFTGCKGGDAMNVAVGDKVLIDMTVRGQVWTQTATDLVNQRSVSFDFDLQNQAQGIAELVIEPASQKPVGEVLFTSTIITFASPEPAACRPYRRGANDSFTTPRASKDGRRCCIDRIALRL